MILKILKFRETTWSIKLFSDKGLLYQEWDGELNRDWIKHGEDGLVSCQKTIRS